MRSNLAITTILFLCGLCDSANALTTTTLCQCSPNADPQLTELHCLHDAHTSPPVTDIDLLVRSNCSYFKIKVSHFDLGSIQATTFHAVPNITHVNLYSTYIKTIDRKAFRDLTYLTGVELRDNSLLTIDSDLFIDNPHLTTVSLSHNPLVRLATDTSILKSDSITELDLSFCKLTRVTVAMFASLPHLQRLNLSSNNLQRVPPGMLLVMPRLTALDVSNNRGECACLLKEILGHGQKVGEAALPTIYCKAPSSDIYWPTTTPKGVCAGDVATAVPSDATVEDVSGIMAGKLETLPPAEMYFKTLMNDVGQSSPQSVEVIVVVLGVVAGFVLCVGLILLLVTRMMGIKSRRSDFKRHTEPVNCGRQGVGLVVGPASGEHVYEQIDDLIR